MCQYTRAGDWKVLQRGGFFGPNASGKSSFIKSLAFAKSFIVNGQKAEKEPVSISSKAILKI